MFVILIRDPNNRGEVGVVQERFSTRAQAKEYARRNFAGMEFKVVDEKYLDKLEHQQPQRRIGMYKPPVFKPFSWR